MYLKGTVLHLSLKVINTLEVQVGKFEFPADAVRVSKADVSVVT